MGIVSMTFTHNSNNLLLNVFIFNCGRILKRSICKKVPFKNSTLKKIPSARQLQSIERTVQLNVTHLPLSDVEEAPALVIVQKRVDHLQQKFVGILVDGFALLLHQPQNFLLLLGRRR